MLKADKEWHSISREIMIKCPKVCLKLKKCVKVCTKAEKIWESMKKCAYC
jgi:hypothetical protein